MSVKIGLDAGHGLKTSGKQTPDGIHEWELNDKVRDKVVKFLSDYDCEIIHTDKDEGKVDDSLADRWKRYMNAGVSAFVSIHHNANTGKWNNATGVETFVDNGAIPSDVILANCIHKRLVKYTGMRDRGIKRKDFYVINQDKIPAVLVEGGFMDGKEDYKIITSDKGQTAYAKAVAEGLIEFLDLKKKKVAPKKETPKKETTSTKCFKKYTGESKSIVDALKSIGATSTLAYRKKIAKANGIKTYIGTASQNTKLLTLLKKGKLIKP